MNHCTEIEQYLYLGNYYAARDADPELIKVILSVISDDYEIERKAGIDYYRMVASNDFDEDLLTYFEDTYLLISHCVEAQLPILVHCVSGDSRSATIVCAYVMKSRKVTDNEAIYLVRERRPTINPIHSFRKQLQLYGLMRCRLYGYRRAFRNYLIQKYLRYNVRTFSVDKYLERLAVVHSKTKASRRAGQHYICTKCGTRLFNEINIVSRETLPAQPPLYCEDIYIDLLDWMGPQVKEPLIDANQERNIHCWACFSPLATFRADLRPYELRCGCEKHRQLGWLTLIKVIPNSVQTRPLSPTFGF